MGKREARKKTERERGRERDSKQIRGPAYIEHNKHADKKQRREQNRKPQSNRARFELVRNGLLGFFFHEKTIHFSLISSTCFASKGSRIFTFTSSFPLITLRPWVQEEHSCMVHFVSKSLNLIRIVPIRLSLRRKPLQLNLSNQLQQEQVFPRTHPFA